MEDHIESTMTEMYNVRFDGKWNVLSDAQDHELYLVHYGDDFAMEGPKYPFLRGVVIDNKRKYTVCKSFDYTENVVTDSIPERLSGDGWKYSLGVEGTIIRVFKHEGIVYYSTQKKLDASRSRWGNSPLFLDSFVKYHGPSGEKLFSPESKFSSVCYIFMVVNEDILVSSKIPVGEGFSRSGFVVYMGSNRVLEKREDGWYQGGRNVFPAIDAGDIIDPGLPEDSKVLETISLFKALSTTASTEPFLVHPMILTKEEADMHLQSGFTATGREAGYGEFVIAWNGDPMRTTKITSKNFQNWLETRNGNPNIYHQFHVLMDKVVPFTQDGIAILTEENPNLADAITRFGERNFKTLKLFQAIPRAALRKNMDILQRCDRDFSYAMTTIQKRFASGKEVPFIPEATFEQRKVFEYLKHLSHKYLYTLVSRLKQFEK